MRLTSNQCINMSDYSTLSTYWLDLQIGYYLDGSKQHMLGHILKPSLTLGEKQIPLCINKQDFVTHLWQWFLSKQWHANKINIMSNTIFSKNKSSLLTSYFNLMAM